MPRTPSPAQRAVQVTFVLKGHLKNVQIAYLRAGAMLAKVRDESLYRALGHDTMESYAAERLGLQRASLYRYLQIHDWVRGAHPRWLAAKPKGFIPELSDVAALMWIERRLEEKDLGDDLRRRLAAMRTKAFSGKLTEKEFRTLQTRAKGAVVSLRSFLKSLRAIRRQAERVPRFPAEALVHLDTAIGRVEGAVKTTTRIARLGDLGRIAFVPRVVRGGKVSTSRLG